MGWPTKGDARCRVHSIAGSMVPTTDVSTKAMSAS